MISARRDAQALVIAPSSLLTAEGQITVVSGIFVFVDGICPLFINNLPPIYEEMALGMLAYVWGGMVCYGAHHMHELKSYRWAMVGSVLGVLPLLVGMFGVFMLQNPKVKAGFNAVVPEET
jgi:hypothetical protein